MKSGMGSLFGIVGITATLLVITILVGNTPQLGLDLRGGVEVVLRPADDEQNLALAAEEGNLQRAAEIIRRRVDAIGVAEPDVTVQDNDIVVQLPGVEDQQRAVDLVGQTAELRFRPVIYPPINLRQLGQAAAQYQAVYGTLSGDVAAAIDAAFAEQNITLESGDTSADGSVDVTPDESGDETGFGLLVEGESALGLAQDATAVPTTEDPTTEDPTTEDPTTADPTTADPTTVDPVDTGESPFGQDLIPGLDDGSVTLTRLEGINGGAGTDELFSALVSGPEQDMEDASVVFVDDQFIYLLGPTMFTGAALQGAEPQLSGAGWSIAVDFKSGAEGLDLLNDAAFMCNTQQAGCPLNQMATVLDRRVDSTVGFNAPVFTDNRIQITRGQIGFPEDEARDTALVLDFGALPVEFQDPTEAGLVRTVSSTLGEGSLRAGLIAGAIGVLLVAMYMIWYYRMLGIAALLSLVVSASMLYIIVSYLSASRGLALTLAGIVGLIVSIGVSLDSNVVYFEHLKEDIGTGRTLRSATDKAFPVAFKTVFWANLATLIGAVILFLITVGSVKGFALMLGIASVLDLVATYFFMRPLVHWLANRPAVEARPGLFGIGMAGRLATKGAGK